MKRRKTSATTERTLRKVRAKVPAVTTTATAGGTQSSDKTKMATKNCPQCSKQVPVACKKCGCGHVFFATRRSATSTNRENSEEADDMPISPTESQSELKPTRRSGRVTRERPNFYDALQYENQTRRAKDEEEETEEETGEGSDTTESTFPQVFVTVGSTRFDDLITLVLKDDRTMEQFVQWKTKKVIVQKGNSSVSGGMVKSNFIAKGIQFQVYDFKPFILEDMKWADLIISHAGAGTTIEALDLHKPLIVVPNRNLMDDHQLELAGKLAEGNHAVLTSIKTFHEDMKDIKKTWFKPLPEKRTQDFINFLNETVLGIKPEDL